MRALIADEHALNRAGLRNVLVRAGFDVEEVQDELGAACVLFQPNPPQLAFVATDTVLVDFATICKALRAADAGVYIVALVPDSREHDALSFLKLGADDYMVKSRPITAVQARLKVIRQNMERRAADRIADANPLDLSPESTPQESAESPEETVVRNARENPFAPEGRTLVNRFSLPAVVRALQSVLSTLGLEARVASGETSEPQAFFAGWLPVFLLLGSTGEWINVRLDFDAGSANALLRASREEAHASDAARLTSVREILNLLQAQLTATIPESSSTVSFPLQPVSTRAEELPGSLLPTLARKQSTLLTFGDGSHVRITVAIQLLKSEDRGLLDLKPYDVLASPLRAGRALTLLRAGVMLDPGYISRLQVLARQQESTERVKVFRPPAGTLLFLTKLAG